MMHCVNISQVILQKFLLAVLFIYKSIVSPFIHFLSSASGTHMSCKYPISCSEFAIDELRKSKSTWRASLKIFKRIISCAPWQSFMRVS